MADQPVGKITHYYDKVGVAVVEVKKPLAVGDMIKVSGHDKDFTQKIESMQIEHEQIQKAGKGKVVGMKLEQPVKEHDLIFKA
ncbi:MAG: U32 family peptidase C-terminal domain-containing protein [bacterium]|nr:U32 family peptidase C-terminal domain-containing protein [bacterium]